MTIRASRERWVWRLRRDFWVTDGVWRLDTRLWVMFGFLLLVSSPVVLAQIALDQNFECGSLDITNTTVSNPNSNNPTFTLVPRYNGGQQPLGWWWMYFSASGLSNKTPTFQASTVGSTISFDNNTRWVYSYDQVNWQFFSSGTASGGIFSFSNSTAFSSDKVYVATAIPYGPSKATALINSIKNNPWVLPTQSGDTNLVVGYTLGSVGGGYTDDLGRAVAAQNLYGFKVTDPSVTVPKTKIVIMSGNHSGEPPGNMALEGMVNFLISNDPRMQQLRRHAEFYFYPLVDPEGRAAGYFISTPQNPNKNHNRFWNNPAGFTDITTIENAMRADTGGTVDYFFDFHSEWQPDKVEILAPTPMFNSQYTQLLTARDSSILVVLYNFDISSYAQGWGGSTQGLSATYTTTLEMGTLAGAQQSTYDHYGQVFALAFYDLLAGAPTGLTATAGDAQVALSWDVAAGAVSYNVKRSTTSGGPYVTITNEVTTTNYTDVGLSNGTTYFYVVSAVNTLGEGATSAEASARPSPFLTAVNSGGGAAGTFVADTNVTGGAAASFSSAIDTNGLVNPAPQAVYQTERWGSFSYTFSGLVPGAAYAVRLHFAEVHFSNAGQRRFNVLINGVQVLPNFDIIGFTGARNKATIREFTTTANGTGQIIIQYTVGSADQPKSSGIEILIPPPSAPVGLVATGGNAQVSLAWSTSFNATSYHVRRSTVSGGPYTTVTNRTMTTYTDSPLTNGVNYYYVVSAVNGWGESVNSLQASATPLTLFAQWQLQYFGCTNCTQATADANADGDGDGFTNLQEFQAGTDPTNSASAFRIIGVTQEGDDIRVTWITGSGKTNALERSTDDVNGSYSNTFVTMFTATNTVGGVTNYLENGGAIHEPARYYRIRLVP